jgi:hypothetical protein
MTRKQPWQQHDKKTTMATTVDKKTTTATT